MSDGTSNKKPEVLFLVTKTVDHQSKIRGDIVISIEVDGKEEGNIHIPPDVYQEWDEWNYNEEVAYRFDELFLSCLDPTEYALFLAYQDFKSTK